MADDKTVLAANDAFYRAFAAGDAVSMVALWADAGPLACIHPGWPPLVERSAILESWRRILTGRQRPQIACELPQAFVLGDVAVVICYERIEDQYLVATNVFRRAGDGWKMVHHHAGPAPPPERERRPPGPLH